MTSGNLIGVIGHLGSLHHGIGIAAIYLYPDWRFLIVGSQFVNSLFRIPYQTLGRHEFRIYHVCAQVAAYPPEGCVCNILHRRKQHRPVSQLNRPYIHDEKMEQSLSLKPEQDPLYHKWHHSCGLIFWQN